ncbi:MAG TPA: hypothetical protein VIP51_13915 [Eoetvoesiella sp.]
MNYPLLVTIHLFAAIMFVGTVFFEVLVLESVRKRVPHDMMRILERGIGLRARQIMPWVVLALYLAGIALAWQHRPALANPFGSTFGILLTLKIVLAVSVFAHFLTAMMLFHTHRMTSLISRRIHISVFFHVVGIVLLAKAMFYVHW